MFEERQFRLTRRTFPLLLGSAGLIFLAMGFGDLTFVQIIGVWNYFMTIIHQPLMPINTSDASLAIDIGIFLVVLASISYLVPKIIDR